MSNKTTNYIADDDKNFFDYLFKFCDWLIRQAWYYPEASALPIVFIAGSVLGLNHWILAFVMAAVVVAIWHYRDAIAARRERRNIKNALRSILIEANMPRAGVTVKSGDVDGVFTATIYVPKHNHPGDILRLVPVFASEVDSIFFEPISSLDGRSSSVSFNVVLENPIAEPLAGKIPVLTASLASPSAYGCVPVGLTSSGQTAEMIAYSSELGASRVLVVGGPGTGKSTVPLELITWGKRMGWTLWVSDNNGQTFGQAWKDGLDRLETTPEGYVSMLSDAVDEMKRRVEVMVQSGSKLWTPDLGPLMVLLFEEWSTVTERFRGTKKDRDAIDGDFLKLAAECRKTGIILVVSNQTANADAVPSSARSNFNIVVAHRLRDSTQTHMALPGAGDTGVLPHKIPGRYDKASGFDTSVGMFVLDQFNERVLARGWFVTVADTRELLERLAEESRSAHQVAACVSLNDADSTVLKSFKLEDNYDDRD